MFAYQRPNPRLLPFLTLGLLLVLALLSIPASGTSAQVQVGAIAYVLQNDEQGDEIHLIASDGSGDRRIWRTNRPDPHHVEDIYSLAWHPDATELVFVSDHEGSCSLFDTDLFSIRPDGSGYRRITQAPACAELAGYPQGRVRVPVRNFSFDASVFFIYFQGAPGIELITLGPGQSGVVTFESVADLGDGDVQSAIAIGGAGRWLDIGASADVQPGGEVTTPVFTISGQAFPEFGADWPSWHRDGDKLAYVLGFSSLYQIPSTPEPLALGIDLLQEGTATPLFVNNLKWGPTPATANQILYDGGGGGGELQNGIYLTTAGSDRAGERLVTFEAYDLVYGLAWLPDASGFVYSVTEEFLGRSNVFVYRFATGESTRLTSFTDRYAQVLSVSPDGQQVVFDRAVNESELGLSFTGYEVWVVDVDGENLRQLVAQGRAPAWSPRTPPVSPAPVRRVLLPHVVAP